MTTFFSPVSGDADLPRGRQTVLIVDDTPEIVSVLGGILQPYYRVRAANSGPRALQVAVTEPRPDIILLDVIMPGLDGYTVLERLREQPETRDIPVIFVTALDDTTDEEHGLSIGAVDYITKPVRPAIVLARVRAHLELKLARDWLKNQNAFLENEVSRRMSENLVIQDVSIHALANLAETRHPETGHHLRRTQGYVEILARYLSALPAYAGQLDSAQISLIAKAAPLHDIGKVGIPDQILLKPGKLTEEEFAIMKRHAQLGGKAIEEAIRVALDAVDDRQRERLMGAKSLGGELLACVLRGEQKVPLAFLGIARQIAQHHHEKWNGTGYPDGLAGTDIPLPARLMALADVFDALTCRRCYKEPMPFEKAVRIIVAERGAHFDPGIVDAFQACLEKFCEIAERYADDELKLAG